MKLATSKLATSKLATFTDNSSFVPIEFEGLLAAYIQDVGFKIDGAILQFQQSISDDVSFEGVLCNVSQSVVVAYDGVIGQYSQTVADMVTPDEYDIKYPFKSNVFGNFGRFGMEINGSGVGRIDVCRLCETVTLKFEEGKAAIAEFSLLQNAGTVIDLFQLLNESITIELTRPNQPNYIVYTGKISQSAHTIGNRIIKWTATQSREQLINKMTQAQVSSIGYFNENVFRPIEEYKDNNEQLTDRLKTIPASLEFINGTPRLVSWFVKDAADYTLSACDILRANLQNDVTSQDSIVNHVTIKIQYQYDLLYQSDRRYRFDSQYTVCDYSTHGLPPTNDSIRSAVESTGWRMTSYDSIGLHEGGIYRCRWRGGYPAEMIWSPRSGEAYIADPNNPTDRSARTVINYTNMYANSANFTASKRWSQPIEEQINVIKQNPASIERYEKREDSINVTIRQDRSLSTNRTIKNWEEYTQINNPSQFGFTKQANGYWTRKVDDINKGVLEQALSVANRVADCMILESHRSIETTLTLNSIAPQIDITQTHNVTTEKISGKFKAYNVEHVFDCINKNYSKTTVTYKLFANKQNQPYQVNTVTAPRANVDYFSNPTYNNFLGVHDIDEGAQVFYSEDEFEEYQEANNNRYFFGSRVFYYNLRGLINEEARELDGVKFYQAKEFQFIADEIEEDSTDDREFSAQATFNMNIPNDAQNLVA